jgi:hypothetical protein
VLTIKVSEPRIESWSETRWRQLTDEERVQHTLSNSELYRLQKQFKEDLTEINKIVKDTAIS